LLLNTVNISIGVVTRNGTRIENKIQNQRQNKRVSEPRHVYLSPLA